MLSRKKRDKFAYGLLAARTGVGSLYHEAGLTDKAE